MADTSSSISAFLQGAIPNYRTGISAYLGGATAATPTSIHAYLTGNAAPTASSISAFLKGANTYKSSVHAYIGSPVFRSSIHAYMTVADTISEEDYMTTDYIELTSSDSSITGKFRVLAEGYDDGTLDKSQTVDKTIGGGIDASVGEVYKSWSPIIRVRHNETQAGYGDLQDLIDLYSLNDPGGTPNNKITFIDHHEDSRTILMLGSFRKQTLTCQIEGENAWFIVRLVLQEVV